LGTRKLDRSAQKLYTDVTINLRVGEKLEQFLSTSGVKQGDNLAPVPFIFVIHGIQLSTRNGISQPLTLDGFRTLKLEASREDNYAEPLQQGQMFSFFKSYYVDTAFILLSRGEVIAASSYRLSLSTFWSDYSHWK
jgi:hypothetical protein